MEEFGSEQVAQWLTKLGLVEAANVARDQQVDGDVLLALVEDGGLADLSVSTAMARAKIVGGLKKLARTSRKVVAVAADATQAGGGVGPAEPEEPVAEEAEIGRGRAIREALRAEVDALKSKLEHFTQDQVERTTASIDDGTADKSIMPPTLDTRQDISQFDIVVGDYKTCPAPSPGDRGPYPRPCMLSVLAPEAAEIKVYDLEHVSWCIDQFMGADPDLGGEETLDLDIAPGVHTVPMSARVPPDGEECGGLLQPAAGVPTGPTAVWFKTTNTDGGFGGLRGRSEWMVPARADMDCRVLFIHGGSHMWYSGVDKYYRPLTSRIAKESGMPVLSIDFRLAPEYAHPAGLEDCIAALDWMSANGPAGKSAARKIFVVGDSSGGGLALSVALAARDRAGCRPPDGCIAICPLTDLTYDFARKPDNSYLTRIWDKASRTGDPVFTSSYGNLLADKLDRQERAKAYCPDLKDPLASPLWAENFANLPPLMLLAADEDLSVDDAVDFAEKAAEAGTEVDLCVWPRVWHDWVMCTEGRDKVGNKQVDKPMKEAVVAIEHIGVYLKRLGARA